jgi:hypothetical protein
MRRRDNPTGWRRRAAAGAYAAAFAAAVAAPAAAEDEGMRRGHGLVGEFAHYEVVPDEELGKMRGGFLLPAGILNFAIDVAAQFNGQRIYDGQLSYSPGTGFSNTVTHYDTTNLGVPVSGKVKLGDAINQIVTSVQAGDGNVAPTRFNGANGFVVTVQNSLSNVVIQQQMQVRLDLEASRFIQSQTVTNMRSRLGQLRHMSSSFR